MTILHYLNSFHALFWTIVFLVIINSREFYGSVCDHIQTTSKVPALPFISNTFQVNVEANIINKGKTVSATLYYDYPGNRATLKLFEHGLDGRIILNYKMDEVYTISGDQCTTNQLSTSKYSQWFGYSQSNGIMHINNTHWALHFGKQYGEVFVGKEIVRGMSVNHWKSCPSMASWNNFTIDYYFTEGNWSTSSTVPSAPVKAEVRGSKTFANGTVYSMHHIYDYYNYMPGIDDIGDTIFQTPTNVACPGRKQGRPLPRLPARFYYRTERVYTDLSAITFEDTWYDEAFQLFRQDYRPLTPVSPLYTTNPLTEIHDYKSGVRYVIDQTFGNCTTTSLSSNLMDTVLNITAMKLNGSFVINMKNPLQLFHLDWNYTYIGQNTVRDILCDTFIAVSDNLTINGFVNNQRTTITFYFTAQEWTNVFDTEGVIIKTSVPVKMDLLADELGFATTFNFLDFDPNAPNFDVFDINKCFHEGNKVTFQLKFPGTMTPLEGPDIKHWAHLVLAQKMDVSLLRITSVNLNNDDANIFISATLLDKTSVTAQFTKIAGKVMEVSDDQVIYKSSSVTQCASYCVNNPTFICNSFDICSTDKSCRLSKTHTEDGVILNTSRTCDHYSRNVDGILPEKTIAAAYQLLRKTVYSGKLQLNKLGNRVYTAVDVTLTFGWVNPNVKLPTQMTGAYSYEVEVSVPATQHVYSAKVWYDDGFKMIRYDVHYNNIQPPYFSTNPISIVEDYNTGIKYITDTIYQNCTVAQIAPNDLGTDVSSNKAMNSTYRLSIKDPLQMFRIDNTYFFVGQATIRGMTCNVFESIRSDFVFGQSTVNAIFRYFFLSDKWMEISDGYLGGAVGQPVRLEITILKPTFYMEYNFYNFDTDHPDMSLFDVAQCYTAQNTRQFQITFPLSYEDYLTTSAKIFTIEASFKMARYAGVSLHRFQRTRLDHDRNSVYVTSSLVEQPNKLLYFTRMPSGFMPGHVDKVLSTTQTIGQCATSCFGNSDFLCNSFYVCTQSGQCLLSKKHAPDGPNQARTTCIAYSRTVNNSTAELSNMVAVLNLQNAVFANNFTAEIPIPNSDKIKMFSATYIKDVFLTDQLHDKQDNSLLNFDIHSQSTVIPPTEILANLDVGSCSAACMSQTSFQCRGFSYCFNNYYCGLSNIHPDQIDNKDIKSQTNCTTYNRNYINEYNKMNGVISVATPAVPQTTTVQTDALCAKSCSTNTGCRMFEYCVNTKQCLLYNERSFGSQQNNPLTASCNLFTSPYDKDFQAVNVGTYTFVLIISLQGTSKTECARHCVQLQSNQCTGFYFCDKTTTCYLPGSGNGVVAVPGGEFCKQFKRIHFPHSAQIATTKSTGSKSTGSKSTGSKSTRSSTTRSSTTGSSTTRSTATLTAAVAQSIKTGDTFTATPTSNTPCSSLQRQSTNNNKITSGTTIGISVGTFLLGLLLGAVGLFIFRKYRNLDKDDLKTNFVEHEDM